MTNTIRTSAADINLLSCSANVWGLNEGSDHAQTLDKQPDPVSLMPEVPSAYSSLLKICDGTHDIILPAPGTGYLDIAQGMENSVDFNNRVSNVTVAAHFGQGGGTGDQVLTVKGGCHDCRFTGFIHSEGHNAMVVVGNWSDQCFDESYNLDFTHLVRADDEPITFILSRCHDIQLPPGAVVLKWKSLGYSAYWWFKRAYVGILKLIGKA